MNVDYILLIRGIKDNYRDSVEKIIRENKINFNYCDSNGNNILMLLLKYRYYDLVLEYMNDDHININHQNNDGDTFAHILVSTNYLEIRDILRNLLNNKNLNLDILNNNNESILDKSINYNYLYTTSKIIIDKRFENIDLFSFKNLFETYIKSNNYGIYSKVSNFKLIYNSLNVKRLLPGMERLFSLIKKYYKDIMKELLNSNTSKLDYLIDYVIKSN